MKAGIIALIFILVAWQTKAQQVLMVSDTAGLPVMHLEEVDIRSSKENTEIQKLPVSATSLKSKRIENELMNTTAELSSRVPNLFMPDYGSKLTSPVYIRGIGSRINSPSVGLYVDGVPYFEKAAFNFAFFDIERVEVLRGPQGTLYGRNTMGGIINIYTEKPGKLRKTKFSLYGGNYHSFKLHIAHDQPLGENLSLGVNGLYKRHDGYFINEYNDEAVDKLDTYSGRIRLVYTPDSPWEAEYSMNMEISRQGGYPYALRAENDTTANEINYNEYSFYDRDLISNNLKLRYKQDHLEFNSITSYQYLNGYQEIDQDFTPASLVLVTQDEEQNMLSQEFNLQNKLNHYTAVTGMFAFLQYTDKQVGVDYGADAIPAFNLPGPMSKIKLYDQLTRGAAFYHQSSWNHLFIDGLAFTAGIRVDYEKAFLNYNYDMILNDKIIPQTAFDNSLEFFEILPKTSLHYKLAEELNAYLTVSKGYKTGGFNSTFERPEDRTFDPEKSWNYEAGIKSKWIDRRLMANLAVFYIDWYDQQIYQPVPSGQGSMLKNAGHSESKGLEVELSALPAPRFSTYASFGYVDARFLEYKEDSLTDYSGNRIPYIPRFTFSLGGNYKHFVNAGFLNAASLNLNYQGVGEHYWDEANMVSQPYYGLLNTRLTFHTKWMDIGFWGKNILGAEYNAFYFEALGNQYLQRGKPARYGIFISAAF